MREMKNSGVPWIGEIPRDWKLLRNKNAFLCSKEIVGNKSATTQLLSLTTKGIKEKGPDVVGGKVPESFDTYQAVHKGQLVMCLFDLDCSAVFSGLSPFDGMISPAYKVLDCKAGMDPSFAGYWFSSVFDGRKFMHYSKNLRYTLTYDEFAVLPMIIPTLAEQRRIADFLDAKCAEIDSVLEKTKASIEEYKKLKQSVITEAVTKGVRGKRPMKYSGLEWIGEIPEDWDVLKNSLLFRENIRMPNPGAISLSLSQEDGLIPTDEMKESALKTSTYDGWKQVHVDDLVLNRFKAHLGVFFSATLEGIVSFHYGVFEPRVAISSKYFEYLYHSDPYRAIYANKSNGMVVGLQNLSNQNFYSVKSLVPPLREQQEIAAYLDSKCAAIDSLISSKEALVAELETYKKSLIYEYVTGKKEVPAV